MDVGPDGTMLAAAAGRRRQMALMLAAAAGSWHLTGPMLVQIKQVIVDPARP